MRGCNLPSFARTGARYLTPTRPFRRVHRLQLPAADWLGLGSRNGPSDNGAPLEPPSSAPMGVSGSLTHAAGDAGANATIQELARITECSWQLCAQALQAANDDPQR